MVQNWTFKFTPNHLIHLISQCKENYNCSLCSIHFCCVAEILVCYFRATSHKTYSPELSNWSQQRHIVLTLSENTSNGFKHKPDHLELILVDWKRGEWVRNIFAYIQPTLSYNFGWLWWCIVNICKLFVGEELEAIAFCLPNSLLFSLMKLYPSLPREMAAYRSMNGNGWEGSLSDHFPDSRFHEQAWYTISNKYKTFFKKKLIFFTTLQ